MKGSSVTIRRDGTPSGAPRLRPRCAMRKCRPLVKAHLAIVLGLFSPALLHGVEIALPQKIEFNRDVRPILAENCFKCHGFDKKQREANRRLDTREGATADNDGVRAITPGNLAESDLHLRIRSNDKDDVMPPPDSGKKLSDSQKAILDRWIEQGAEYQQHWAYLPIARPTVPPVGAEAPAASHKAINAIDQFVRAHLASIGLTPSPEADRATLARRLSLDLTGLPPAPGEMSAFLTDAAADAYERLVQRLLASPAFGERMAVYWLDVVRYADTIGFHSDNPRNVWPYRDWVIRAFNENKPFDQFTIEQLAGDLLPSATIAQKVASTFNRLNLTTEEGGAQSKDYEARTVADRVRAVGTTWLGQTIGCAQCHDHKYDPMTTRDFYQLGAFFADIKESAIGRREEGIFVLNPAQETKLKELEQRVIALQAIVDRSTPELVDTQRKWESEQIEKRLLPTTELLPAPGARGKKLPPEVIAILIVEPARRTTEQETALAKHYRGIAPELAQARTDLERVAKEKEEFEKLLPRTLASESMSPPRVVRILPRGDWQNEAGEVVQPGVLHFLPPPEARSDGSQPNLTRLDLARWIVSRNNPLTARVFVNRLWKIFFGIGLSKTLDDFGTQGEVPIHGPLLDWLASEFIESGWNVKHLITCIVTSDTYRQTSAASKELQQRDPDNRELARQSRFRLDAEFVRDNALAIAGLLVPNIGGPSVKPYQPAGYWENLNFPVREWENAKDENQWRRGLYTHWQRSYLHPSLLAFDAPSREECTAERVRSNIPQQALALLNDPTYVEAARVLANRIVHEGGADTAQRLTWAFRNALARNPRADEIATLTALLEKHRALFANHPQAPAQLFSVGIAPAPAASDPAEVAAWTSVARVILNLHETITRS